MDEILFIIDSAFTRGGFTVEPEESGVDLWKKKDVRYAIPKIKKIETSKCVGGLGLYLGIEATVTAEVKCYGRDCEFRDGPYLRDLIAGVGRILLLQHGSSIRWISTGETVQDTLTGRNVITVTLEIKGYDETEVETA